MAAIGYSTSEESKRAALAELQRRQCASGRHVLGCPHRPKGGTK